MNTPLSEITDKVRTALDAGYKKKSIAKHIGVSRVTFDKRLKKNSWKDSELIILQEMGIA